MSQAYYCDCGAQWHGALVASDAARKHRRLRHPELTHKEFLARAVAVCACLPCRQTRAVQDRAAVRAKMSAARKAALADPAVRAKMSAASKAALADPAVRAKMSGNNHPLWNKHHSEETRQKMRAAHLTRWAVRRGLRSSETR